MAKVKKIMGKDRTLFNMCSKTGHFTSEQAYRLNRTTEDRLGKLISSGFLEKHNTKDGNVYVLGPNAKSLMEDLYHPAGYRHDLALTEKYLELREDYNFKTGYSYCRDKGLDYKNSPDMVLVNKFTGEIRMVEVITPNYKLAEIEQKFEFALEQGVELERIDVPKY